MSAPLSALNRRRLRAVFTLLVLLFSLLLSLRPADADDLFNPNLTQAPQLLKVRELSIEYWKFKDGARDPLCTISPPKEQLDFNISTDVLDYAFIDTQLHSMTDQYQYRVAGLRLKLGLHVSRYLDVFYQHTSTHVLDSTYPYDRFPEGDALGLKVYIVRPLTPNNTLVP